MKYCILLLTLVLVTISCKSKKVSGVSSTSPEMSELDKPMDSASDHSALYDRTWTHAREQSTDGNALYLDASHHTFPPSRYRNSFEFNPDGTCRFMYLSPTDRHIMIDGSYTYVNGVLHIMTVDGHSYKTYTLLELDDQHLLLKAKPMDNE